MMVSVSVAAVSVIAAKAAPTVRHVTIASRLSNCITEGNVHSLSVLVVKVAHLNGVNLIVMVRCTIAHFVKMDGLSPVHLVTVNELCYLRRSGQHVAIVRIVAAVHASHHSRVVALLEASSKLTSNCLLIFATRSIRLFVFSGLAEFKAIFDLLDWLRVCLG